MGHGANMLNTTCNTKTVAQRTEKSMLLPPLFSEILFHCIKAMVCFTVILHARDKNCTGGPLALAGGGNRPGSLEMKIITFTWLDFCVC